MRRFVFRLSIALLAFAMFAFVVAPSPAHAASSPLTARGPQHARPNDPLPPPVAGALDVDLIIQAQDSPSATNTYFAATGRLTLKLKSGSTTVYSGSFIDNQGGGKKYPASAVGAATITSTTINTHLGKFVFDANGNSTSVPSKLGSLAKASIVSPTAHGYSTITYNFSLTQDFNYTPTVTTGLLTVTYDKNLAIVNNSTRNNVTSTLSVTINGKTTITPLLSGGVNDPTASIGLLWTVVKVKGQLFTLYSTADNAGVFDGFATTAGTGAKAVYAFFNATPTV